MSSRWRSFRESTTLRRRSKTNGSSLKVMCGGEKKKKDPLQNYVNMHDCVHPEDTCAVVADDGDATRGAQTTSGWNYQPRPDDRDDASHLHHKCKLLRIQTRLWQRWKRNNTFMADCKDAVQSVLRLRLPHEEDNIDVSWSLPAELKL